MMVFGWAHVLLLLVVAQRLAELVYARRNAARLLARGGSEIGAEHYWMFITLHTAWLVALFLLTQPNPPVHVVLIVFYGLLQLARLWIIATLGPYWTTRIITLPGAALQARGPYRWVRHPNYLVVALEIPLLPLILQLPLAAIIFGGLNLALLHYRISVEDKALAPRRNLRSVV